MWLLLLVFAPVVLLLLLLMRRRRGCSTSMRGQHVLVTGGSSGMGLAAAVCAARRGASVTLVARDADRLEMARTAVQSAGAGGVLAVSCDVAGDADAVRDAVLRAERQLGPVHVLLCCAGFAVAQRTDQMPLAVHRRLMDVNYFGTLQVLHATLPLMRARRRGRVCLVSSIGGLVGLWGFSSYCGSKFALVGLAQVLMQELRPHGVSVTIGLPPDTDTPGFAEENRNKPVETRLVSESAGLVSAEVMGARLLDDTLAGRVSSTVGVEGWMMAALGLAVAPIDSWRRLLLQAGLLGPLRLVMAGVHRGWDAAIQRCADQNDSDKQL